MRGNVMLRIIERLCLPTVGQAPAGQTVRCQVHFHPLNSFPEVCIARIVPHRLPRECLFRQGVSSESTLTILLPTAKQWSRYWNGHRLGKCFPLDGTLMLNLRIHSPVTGV